MQNFTSFQDALNVKICLNLLNGLQSCGVKLRGRVSLKFQRPLAAELCVGAPKVLEMQERAKFGGAQVSPAAGAAKNVEFFVGLSVRLSVCLSRS